MKFVLLFGPQAVGKMTVGRELEKITGLKLFHNHMTIELLHPLFGFSSEAWRLTELFRTEIFKTVAASEMEGLIFTYVWAFNQQEDWDFVRKASEIFESQGGEVYLVELEADLEKRLERNRTPYRLEQKPTKRNVEHSEWELLRSLDTYRLNSDPGEVPGERYFRLNNSGLEPEQAARLIKAHFKF
ncbi:AAA family ATPase [Paenibacillus sp. R14(2021)]|uniref:AAA family ATPase n=1 Tax=Paenibacillus sp. R14(2021) TaxID=2859228 RepID=UPI001C613134|nr:AAA family ATPase [Paenibacillus sp. R14(2021)]